VVDGASSTHGLSGWSLDISDLTGSIQTQFKDTGRMQPCR